MSAAASEKAGQLLGKQNRCHGLVYRSFTTYSWKLYAGMREGKFQKAAAHVMTYCEFRMIRRGRRLRFHSGGFLPNGALKWFYIRCDLFPGGSQTPTTIQFSSLHFSFCFFVFCFLCGTTVNKWVIYLM